MVSSGHCLVFGRVFCHFSISYCVAWILCMISYMYPPCQYPKLQLYDIMVFAKLFVRKKICLVCILSFIYHTTIFYRKYVNQTIHTSTEQYQKHLVKQFLSSLRGNWLSVQWIISSGKFFMRLVIGPKESFLIVFDWIVNIPRPPGKRYPH